MIPVHILWTEPFNQNDKKLESCIHMFLSATMIKEVYGQIHIITDEKGEALVRELEFPYDKIHLGMEHVTSDSSFTDAKVLAYRMLMDKMPGYLYFDFDVFISEPIAKNDIIIQCDEGVNWHPYSLYKCLIHQGIQFCHDYEIDDMRFLNMGLFRCIDKKIINDYYETYFTTIYQNKHITLPDAIIPQYKMFLEQTCIYKVLQDHGQLDNIYEHYPRNKKSYNDLIINGEINGSGKILEQYYNKELTLEEGYAPPSDINHIDKTGYTHLMHYKTQEKVLKDVMEYAFKNYPKEFSKLMVNMKYIC